jgi:hypothetical protein
MREMKVAKLFVAILVLVAIVVLPVHIALAQPPPPDPVRSLPDMVERGATFDVIINFTCPADDFNGISLRDTAPDGWSVAVNQMWCNPPADGVKVEGGNQVQLIWMGPYFPPKNFTVRYEVTVPCNATPGNHSFNVDYPSETMLRWHITNELGIANITGPHVVEVIGPTISFTPTSIDFYSAVNGTNPQDQTLELWSSTACMLNWSLSDDADYGGHDWLSESPENGSCTDVHGSATLSVNTSGIPEGEHFANITINADEANNPQEIVSVTLHMSVTSNLEGHVSFAGRSTPPDDSWIEPFEVWLFNPGTTDVVWAGNCTTNNTGWFNISDVVVGTYDMGIKNWTCLSELATNVTVSEGVGAVVDFGTTREGDVNNDDWITGVDRSMFYSSWGSSQGGPGWNPNCDFNRDGWVTGVDRSLMYDAWGESGDLI